MTDNDVRASGAAEIDARSSPEAVEKTSPEALLEIRDLRTSFQVEGRRARAVDGVSFTIHENEVFGLVGESGCGKSVTALSVMRLIPNPPGRIEGGEILFQGRDLLRLPYREMRRIRGNDISMIFQEPMTALDPVFSIGYQLREAILQHRPGSSKEEADESAVEMLELVGIPDPDKRLGNYPHEFSGGMRQRVMIAMALVMEPRLLIADEPTTALDVTIQAQILELILEMRRRTGSSMLLITHDLAVVAETCHRVAVMYGGKIQEVAPVRRLFRRPLHPYTQGLLASLPRPDRPKRERLDAIPGIVPSILELPPGCNFVGRCPVRIDKCEPIEPALVEVEPHHWCRCHVTEERLAGGEPPPEAFPHDGQAAGSAGERS